MLGFHRHISLAIFDLWSIRRGMLQKPKKEEHKLAVAEKGAAVLLEDSDLLVKERVGGRGENREDKPRETPIGAVKSLRVPARL